MKKIRIITNLISIVLLVGFFVYLAYIWKSVPDVIPTHFNFAGEADAYGSKRQLLFEPIMAVALFVLIAAVEGFPKIWNMPVKLTEENREKQLMIAVTMLGLIKILCIAALLVGGYASLHPPVSAAAIVGVLAVIFVVVIVGVIASWKNR